MAVYRIIYGAILIAALVFSQTYAGHLSSVLLITVLVLPLISLILTFMCRLLFRLHFDEKAELLCKGEELYISIPVYNCFICPCSLVVIGASIPGVPENKKANMVFSMAPLRRRMIKLTVPAEYRGEFEFTLNRVYFYDMLKLFRISKKLKLSKSLLVTPRLFDVPGGHSDFSATDYDTRLTAVNSASGERSFVRKYTDGDDIRRIHWKLSSKQEDYMVWQTTKGQASEIAVICDMRDASPAQTDAILEAALAVCLYNLKNEKASVIYCYDPELKGTRTVPVALPETLYEVQQMTARLKTYEGRPDFVSEIRSVLAGKEKTEAVVLITHSADTALAKTAGELSADSSVSVLLTGGAGSGQLLANLPGIRYSEIEPNNIREDISKAILRISGM